MGRVASCDKGLQCPVRYSMLNAGYHRRISYVVKRKVTTKNRIFHFCCSLQISSTGLPLAVTLHVYICGRNRKIHSGSEVTTLATIDVIQTVPSVGGDDNWNIT